MKTPLIESLRALALAVHKDAVLATDPGICRSRAYARDRRYLACASDRELLVELPVVGKSLDQRLCNGTEDSFDPPSDAPEIPVPPSRFAYWVDGIRRHEVASIKAFRQVHHLFSKLELNSPGADEAITSFVQRQESLPESLPRTPLLIAARELTAKVLAHFDWTDIIPRHGPGAVATGEKPWEKFHFKRLYTDMQAYYPADQYYYLNVDALSDSLECNELPLEHEFPHSLCKLVAVPKDFRGPRIIAMEALEKQWIQQGQRRCLVRRIESHPLTRGFVNFASQDVNRRLALRSSMDGSYATLDLKDASDRVSCALVDSIIEEPAISYLRASRSAEIQLPSLEVIRLRSFSPMGSAVCFPIESLTFYALSMSAIHLALNPDILYPKWKHFERLLGSVYVYGDDLVVRSEYASLVVDALESVGLVVNKLKCCTGRFFRESCGVDAYAGQEIQPVRVKHLPDRHSPTSLPSTYSYLNEFRRRGMVNSYDCTLNAFVKEFSEFPFLTCHDDPCGIFTTSFTEAVNWNTARFRGRFNRHLQRMEWLTTTVAPIQKTLAIDGWSQCLRLLTQGPIAYEEGWSRDCDEWSVPHALRRQKRWRAI